VLLFLPALLLAACAQQGYQSGEIGAPPIGQVPTHYYPPPGPPGDPWGPYIREAAAQYNVPDQWIRAVMRQESGGQEQAVSPVGAMGLMQVMPETYEGLRERHSLGSDPFDPHNNILAGTAYIREMYDLFGSPGFLAAYNAGPDRVDAYLSRRVRLPSETVNYLAAVAPDLGGAVPPSGPFAGYVSGRRHRVYVASASATSFASGCDLNAAYDPNHPCSSLEAAATASAPLPASDIQQVGLSGCDPDAAYDPNRPCRPAPSATPRLQLAYNAYCDPDAAYDPAVPCRAAASGAGFARLQADQAAAGWRHDRSAPHHRHEGPEGAWAIQVGAFANPTLARAMAQGARVQAPKQLRSATLTLPPTPYRGSVLYRARLAHLSERAAAAACTQLNRRQLPCIVVRPSRS
jgi:hypothetical protein